MSELRLHTVGAQQGGHWADLMPAPQVPMPHLPSCSFLFAGPGIPSPAGPRDSAVTCGGLPSLKLGGGEAIPSP